MAQWKAGSYEKWQLLTSRLFNPIIPGMHPELSPSLPLSRCPVSKLKLGNRWVRDSPPSSVSHWRKATRSHQILLVQAAVTRPSPPPQLPGGGEQMRRVWGSPSKTGGGGKKEQTIITGLARSDPLATFPSQPPQGTRPLGEERVEAVVCRCLQVEPDNEHNYLIVFPPLQGGDEGYGVLCLAVSWWQKE